ncbi:hypothetical protein D187_002453 [Cystobacter fuscus DSM 2262]|uniref:Uncharacterized protein n=1 Tax=Cystobacter fuscus (strain ATCC 25194 / DSM 2262 / NBRC 100088 / M29) TaxID=1242864 RepID=S9QEG8_CYSF2|nr:hypothetical protein D187_002453 [Cystobacter fuscus DSM 2262]
MGPAAKRRRRLEMDVEALTGVEHNHRPARQSPRCPSRGDGCLAVG